MAIMTGLGFGLVLLYFWLLGHWFARIIMLPVSAVAIGVTAFLILKAYSNGIPHDTVTMVAWFVGVTTAWPASSLPIYYWRRQMRHASLELALR